MTDTIKITGYPAADPMVCRFVVDRPLLQDGLSVGIAAKDEGMGSLIVSNLMAIDGVERIYVAGPQVVVTKKTSSPWLDIGKKVGAAIRESIQSGESLFSESLLQKLAEKPTGPLAEKISKLFVERINPELASHGGFVELVRVHASDIYLRMGGGCQGCASSLITLKQGIEKEVRQVAPEVRSIIDDTDHAAGTNPYFR